MKILFAGDEHPYSAFALKEVIRLALNTWADVTLLAVSPAPAVQESEGYGDPGAGSAPAPGPAPLPGDLFEGAEEEGSPYALGKWQYEWIPLKSGLWEEMLVNRGVKKDLKVRLRAGNEAQEILAEAQEEESDLIVLGCTGGGQCLWQGAAPVPQRVVNDAGLLGAPGQGRAAHHPDPGLPGPELHQPGLPGDDQPDGHHPRGPAGIDRPEPAKAA